MGEARHVRAIALAVIRRPGTGELFVDEVVEPGSGRTFHRLPGGGIEFGETAAATLERELAEEYGLAVTVGPRLGALENQFTYAGRRGHEVALVHEVTPCSSGVYDDARRPCLDQPHITGVWRALDEPRVPLYPEGVDALGVTVDPHGDARPDGQPDAQPTGRRGPV